MARRTGKTTEMELMELRDPQGRKIDAIIRDAFEQAKGNQSVAAELMGIEGSTLYRWLGRLGYTKEKKLRRAPREKRQEIAA